MTNNGDANQKSAVPYPPNVIVSYEVSTPDFFAETVETAKNCLKQRELLHAYSTMLAARNLFGLCVLKLRQALLENDLPLSAEEFLIRALINDSREVSPYELAEDFENHICPWLKSLHLEDDYDDTIYATNAEIAFGKQPVVFVDGTHELFRKWAETDLIPDLLQQAVNVILLVSRAGSNMNDLTSSETPNINYDHRFFRFGPEVWGGIANTSSVSKTSPLVNLLETLSLKPTIMIVDDLTHAYTVGYPGRAPWLNASDAITRLKRLVDSEAKLCGYVYADFESIINDQAAIGFRTTNKIVSLKDILKNKTVVNQNSENLDNNG